MKLLIKPKRKILDIYMNNANQKLANDLHEVKNILTILIIKDYE